MGGTAEGDAIRTSLHLASARFERFSNSRANGAEWRQEFVVSLCEAVWSCKNEGMGLNL